MLVTGVSLAASMVGNGGPSGGYYQYEDNTYYYQDSSWYYYDDYDWDSDYDWDVGDDWDHGDSDWDSDW